LKTYLPLLFIFCILLSSSLYAESITYEKYNSFTPEKKQKLIKKYVKRSGQYHKIKIGTYTVYSDVNPANAIEKGIIMDEYFRKFSSLFNGKFRIGKSPDLFILKNNDSYEIAIATFFNQPREKENSIGTFASFGSKKALFANNEGKKEDVMATLYHEGTHQLLDAYIKRDIPTWFDEGSAENFETWEMTRSLKNNLANSLYRSQRGLWIPDIYPNKGFVKFSKLIHMSQKSFYQPSQSNNCYRSAWASIHYFLYTKSSRNIYNKLINCYKSGKKQSSLLSTKAIENIEKKINLHIESIIIPHHRYVVPAIEAMKKKNYKIALLSIKKMKQLHPLSQTANFYMAWISILMGDLKANHLKTIIQLQSKKYQHPEINFAIAQCYYLTKGNNWKSKAKSFATKAIKANWKHKEAKNILKELK